MLKDQVDHVPVFFIDLLLLSYKLTITIRWYNSHPCLRQLSICWFWVSITWRQLYFSLCMVVFSFEFRKAPGKHICLQICAKCRSTCYLYIFHMLNLNRNPNRLQHPSKFGKTTSLARIRRSFRIFPLSFYN